MPEGKMLCISCGLDYPLDAPVWRCTCGGMLDIVLRPAFDPAEVHRGAFTLWRYQAFIPVPRREVITLGEGMTPLVQVELNGRRVFVKQEHLFPTGSYKDRGASVLITQAKHLGVRKVVEDSSGNAGCAIAAYCARAGITCEIYVPADTSPAKLAQIESYGATLHRVPGSREDTARAVLDAAEKDYYASHSWNPFFFQGTKTFAYEAAEQLGWQAPDEVILPVGNGTLLLGAAIGFNELFRAGVIDRMPRLTGVQAVNCAPLAAAHQAGLATPQAITTLPSIAEGIAIAAPARGPQILAAVKSSGGGFVTVSEAEITQALRTCAAQGFYIEPTAAAAFAGTQKALEDILPGKTVVTAFTGHGLKAGEKILKLLH